MNHYIDYLPFIKNEENLSQFEIEIFTFKLLDEIQNLKLKITQLSRINYERQLSRVEFKKEKLSSKINFNKV